MCSAGGIVRRRRPWKSAAMVAMYLVYLVILIEIASRAFLAICYDTSFLRTHDFIYHFYPELKVAERGISRGKPDAFRILFLGGSVISSRYCKVDSILGTMIAAQTDRTIESCNMALKAQTSRDTWYKYRHLEKYHFDLLVLYHGINELRTNNCPEQIYRDDYSHYSFYHELNTLMDHPELPVISFPAAAHLLFHKTRKSCGLLKYLPRHEPPDDWMKYGLKIRSAQALRTNLENVITRANSNGLKVALMSFAYHIPDDYSKESFAARQLDYDDHLHPIELWGNPLCVKRGLVVHNQVLRELGRKYPHVCFIDQEVLLKRGKANFRDVCHLTENGAVEFARNMFDHLSPEIWARR